MASNVSYISTYVPEESSLTLEQLDSSKMVENLGLVVKEIRKANLHLSSLTEEEVLDQDAI